MCSNPCVIMTVLELSLSHSAEEIFILITSRNKKKFPKKCSQCVSQRRLAQKICIMEEKKKNNDTMSSCLVW